MNIICNKSSLLKGVGTVIRAVSQKTTMPILQCILLKAENQEFSLTANDLELGSCGKKRRIGGCQCENFLRNYSAAS